LIIENSAYSPPSVSDLGTWATNFGLTHPVMADPGASTSYNYIGTEADGSFGLPSLQLIGPGMEVLAVNESHIPASLIESYLPE
jgi:hypothetical protein|tara:strand:+ start:164 stop:415 length:252 start_codon:yes stop_codon:yes gene_type:complete